MDDELFNSGNIPMGDGIDDEDQETGFMNKPPSSSMKKKKKRPQKLSADNDMA